MFTEVILTTNMPLPFLRFFFAYSLWFLKMMCVCHVGLDGIHPRVLWELAEELTKLVFIIYYQSWLIREVADDSRSADVMPIHKEGWKEGQRVWGTAGLSS